VAVTAVALCAYTLIATGCVSDESKDWDPEFKWEVFNAIRVGTGEGAPASWDAAQCVVDELEATYSQKEFTGFEPYVLQKVVIQAVDICGDKMGFSPP